MKKPMRIIFALLILFVLVAAGFLVYFIFLRGNLGKGDYQKISSIKNPAAGLSDEKAIEQFDESFVLYLLASIGASNLHNPPFSSNTPKIEFFVSDDVYNAEIIGGSISVRRGEVASKDIIIRTTKAEAVKMMRDRNYISESFRLSKSSIELVADKTTLFLKGYLNIYNELAENN